MRIKCTFILTLFSVTLGFAQVKNSEISLKDKNDKPLVIQFKETKIPSDKAAINIFLRSQYEVDDNISFTGIKLTNDEIPNFRIDKLQQYYKGIKVENSIVNVTSKDGLLNSINGKVLQINDIDINPKISEEQALEFALSYINADQYIWESHDWEQMLKNEKNDQFATYFPKGEVVIIESRNEVPVLSYKFKIYALFPFVSKIIYINAENGEVIFENPLIKHIEGPADTRYSGRRNIETENFNGQFRLRDNVRGNGIQTFNLRGHGQNYSVADDFIDNDNNWTNAEYNNANLDNAALDAHWGAMMTYDYFKLRHNRNSIDNNGFTLRNYVHADLRSFGLGSNDNAFWWNERMTYGDGENIFDAVVSLDVIAHEIAHGFYEKEIGDVVYERESGAINEGLSDIWGCLVESFAAPEKDTYLIGEDITILGQALRSMSDPHAFNQPDTYGANDPFWINPNSDACPNPSGQNDNCGVHTNSGVINYWFFLLAEGDNGTNANGDLYNAIGFGREKAARILYRAETIYFTTTTNFSEARTLTILAAKDLYGENSEEAYRVAYAWYAVGVGDEPQSVSHYIQGTTQLTPGYRATYFINSYANATRYAWSIPSGCYANYCWNLNYGQGSNRINITAGKTGRQQITCKIYNGSNMLGSQYIEVNVQNPYGGGSGGSGGTDPCNGNGDDPLMINGVIKPPAPCDEPYTFAGQVTYFKKIAIYDIRGCKMIDSENVNSLDINNFPTGVYFIKAQLSNNEIIIKKILK